MRQAENHQCDTVIAGAGVAGLVTALELLKHGQTVYLVDRDTAERIGGLARWAFGGMALCGTRQQRRMKIPDDSALLLRDWHSFADFAKEDLWPKAWAKEYAEHNNEKVYQWLTRLGLKFLPAVNWVERGLFVPGNSVPRYHVLWGTGKTLVETVMAKLTPYVRTGKLNILHRHKVVRPTTDRGTVIGVEVKNEQSQAVFLINAAHVVIACGGINGSSERVKQNWKLPCEQVAEAPFNGANPISDGQLHDEIEAQGGKVTHIDKMWNYAAGIAHPQAEFEGHGLSLIPCKSALWLDHLGKRIGPQPLVTGFDTNYLCQQLAGLSKPWTWQVLNWDVAAKELAVSGSEHNPSIRDKKIFSFLKEIFFGNHRLVEELVQQSADVLCADTLDELTDKMNALAKKNYINGADLAQEIALYDRRAADVRLHNDEQLRRINHTRQWKPDRLRTRKPGPILSSGMAKRDKLIAIRLKLISRKSLGGLQTNLSSQVLDVQGKPIGGLYCVGEAAGFGGGGANGARSLEGTFLSACILTARNAATAIVGSHS
ncbi:FAD-dependent oxidoreductase [Shewanella halifaxensis]|nr:FAD-dependent oxidoreductase [Shewanella halifaxensis]